MRVRNGEEWAIAYTSCRAAADVSCWWLAAIHCFRRKLISSVGSSANVPVAYAAFEKGEPLV